MYIIFSDMGSEYNNTIIDFDFKNKYMFSNNIRVSQIESIHGTKDLIWF